MKIRTWKNHLRWLDYSATERRGIHILLLIILFMILIHWSMPYWIVSRRPSTEISEEVKIWLMETVDSAKKEEVSTGLAAQSHQLFDFDPNTCDDSAFRQLGLKEHQIRNIRNYLAKCGRFRSVEDFGKLYALKEEDKERLLPHVRIAGENTLERSPQDAFTSQHAARVSFVPDAAIQEKEKPVVKEFKSFASQKFPIELNAADTSDLLSLPGIGPAFARRIVRYREKLGGFYSIDQLHQVYKLPPETIELIRDKLILDPAGIQMKNINTISEDELKEFPLLSRTQAKAIIAYREKHGAFAGADDLRKCKVLSESDIEVLLNYFTF